MRAPKQPSDVASDVTGDTTPTPKGKTDHSRIVAHIDGTPGKPNPNSVTITSATHSGQASTFGDTHVQATPAPTSGLRGQTHAVRIEKPASKPPSPLAAEHIRTQP